MKKKPAKKRLCIVCNLREPTVPDREAMGRPVKRVCSECHGARLRGDMAGILAAKASRSSVALDGETQFCLGCEHDHGGYAHTCSKRPMTAEAREALKGTR